MVVEYTEAMFSSAPECYIYTLLKATFCDCLMRNHDNIISAMFNVVYTQSSIFLSVDQNHSEPVQTQTANFPDCTFIAGDNTAVNGLTAIWYTHSGSVFMAPENNVCLRDLLISNDTCDKTFQSVIGLTLPYLSDDRWYNCSIQLNQHVYKQTCLEGMLCLKNSIAFINYSQSRIN